MAQLIPKQSGVLPKTVNLEEVVGICDISYHGRDQEDKQEVFKTTNEEGHADLQSINEPTHIEWGKTTIRPRWTLSESSIRRT